MAFTVIIIRTRVLESHQAWRCTVMSKTSLAVALAASIAFGQAATLPLAAEKSIPKSWAGAKNLQMAFDAVTPVILGLVPVNSEASDIFAYDHVTVGPVRLAQSEVPIAEASSTELVFWQSIQNSPNPKDFESYLQRYPEGAFVDLARNRLSSNTRSTGQGTIDLPWLTGLKTAELIQNTSLRDTIQIYAERKYRFRIRRFKSIEVQHDEADSLEIELQYVWVRDETAVKAGRGTATIQKVGPTYRLVDFESNVPTNSQLISVDR